jgi:hypothetical protein
MIFFIVVLLLSMLMGIYILYEDKKYNNILESVVNYENENPKYNNNSVLNKLLLNKNANNNEHLNDEEKKLLNIRRLI